MDRNIAQYLLTAAALLALPAAAADSQCFGSVSNGRIQDSVKLPARGPNFSAYSTFAASVGRTYVHSKVAAIVAAAYAALAAQSTATTYVYGETGWSSGDVCGRTARIRTFCQ